MQEQLFGLTLEELSTLSVSLGLPKYTGRQLAQWLYTKEVTSFDEMTNLSKKARSILKEHCVTGIQEPVGVQESVDGTRKYLFPAREGKFIETAYIPDGKRHTVCVSSQVGCKMGCLFCMTGKQGFQGNLSSGDILNQYRSIPEWRSITNLVYMGMGEPLDNLSEVLKSLEVLTADWGFALSPRRITVSTIGITPAMLEFLNKSQVHLAISLHTPFDDERKKLMPIQQVYPLKEVLHEIKSWDFGRQRRVSFEYILFKDFNDSSAHVNELSRILLSSHPGYPACITRRVQHPSF